MCLCLFLSSYIFFVYNLFQTHLFCLFFVYCMVFILVFAVCIFVVVVFVFFVVFFGLFVFVFALLDQLYY